LSDPRQSFVLRRYCEGERSTVPLRFGWLVCARADPHPLAMATWLQAFLWGLLAGSALLVGALLGWFAPIPRRAIAGVMGFGAGVLLSALSFDLMGDAFSRGGAWPTALGFAAGAIVYAAANLALARRGAKHRKRSGKRQPSESEQDGSGLAIAVGALLDGIPESAAIGVSLLAGHGVGMVAVIAIFISNLPEGLSSSAGMKAAGRSAAYVFGIWVAIAVLSAISAALGAVIFKGAPAAVAATLAVAAGAILTMIADTMVPEAFEESHDLAGLITVLGFLCAFLLTKLGG
jgi:ZIP family zinc transporter